MTLYELTEEMMALLEMAEDPDIDEQTLADTMEGVSGEFEDKAEAYAMILKELEADEIKLKAEIDRLSAMKKSIVNNADRIKRTLESSMILADKKKFKTDKFSFNIQKNPASVRIFEGVTLSDVPTKFLTFRSPEINKKAVKDAINSGEEVDFAELIQTEGLRIR